MNTVFSNIANAKITETAVKLGGLFFACCFCGSHFGSHRFAGANQTPVRFVQPLLLFDNGFYFAWGFADVWIW